MRRLIVVLILFSFSLGIAEGVLQQGTQPAGAKTPPIIERDIVYGQAGGADLKLDMARPGAGGPFPVVLCIHGGAWQTGSRSGYGAVLPVLAGDGYAAVAVDYRFAPESKYPAQIEDVRQAVKYLATRATELNLDMSRTATLGDSAGGHLALMLGLSAAESQIPGRVVAVVNLYGPTDMTRWEATPAGEAALGSDSPTLLSTVFGTNDRSSPVLKAASPISWVGPGDPAVLTFHGEVDPLVKPEQAVWLHEALRSFGVEEKLVAVKGAGHGFQGADLMTVVGTTRQFLAAHLKAPAPQSQLPLAPDFERIDAHVHVGPPPEAFGKMLERARVRLVNVTVVDPHAPGFDKPEPQTTLASNISRASQGRISWVSTFDPAGWETSDFTDKTVKHLQETFGNGAVAVKIYKSIGMDLKSKAGQYVLPDDQAFSAVLDFIARQDRTLYAHLAEPRSSWRALDPSDPHSGYYKDNPEWHMFLHPERPSWETIIAARDRLLEAHPKLRVVGCHLGSMEHDVDEIAKRLDRYPNFAVDTAARVFDLMIQPRDKVRDFLVRYQDRVIYGTDLVELEWKNPDVVVKKWDDVYSRDWRYFATGDTIEVRGRQIQGLALPPEVLRKIFRENALRWVPGISK